MASTKAFAALIVVATASWLAARGASAQQYDDYDICELYLLYTFRAPPAALAYPPNTQFFRSDSNYEICFTALFSMSAYIDSLFTKQPDAMYFEFGTAPWMCSGSALAYQGKITTIEDALRFKTAIINGARKVATEYFCKAVRNAYGFNVRSDETSCLSFNINVTCSPSAVPFPRTKCNKTPGTTRVTLAPNRTQEPGRNDTTLHCFNITAVQPNDTVPSNCTSNKLARVEIYADDSKRDFVTGLRVTRNGGKPVWGAAAWGPARANSLKVGAPLLSNWNMTEAIGGQICVEISNRVQLRDICFGGAYPSDSVCYLSLFNEGSFCCPTVPVEIGEKPYSHYYG